jgi:hypothetical protein
MGKLPNKWSSEVHSLQIRTEGGVVAESVGNDATKLATDAEETAALSFGQQRRSGHMVSRNFSPWQLHGQLYYVCRQVVNNASLKKS